MKRIVPLIILGALVIASKPVFSVPLGAYDQVMQAVYARDEAMLKYLVSVGLNINATNAQGNTALCTAVENQDYEGYELLLSQGATTRTPCIRDMNPDTLNRFVAEQPPLGSYYKGAALTASRNGVLMRTGKEIGSTIGSLPYPHLGEIVLGGIAVGTAFAVGVHGSSGGGGDGPVPTFGYESPFNNTDTTASNYLSSTYFSAPTKDTLPLTKKGGIPDVTETLATQYQNEYSGGNWPLLVNNIPFLQVIKAADAYARGYSGAMISRNADGKPTASGWDAVSATPVKVAVVDSGLFYHTDFDPSLYTDWISGSSTDTYNGSLGLNYEYGAYSANNNVSYWKYNKSSSTVELYENGSKVLPVSGISSDDWNIYQGKFAPVCGSGTDSSGNCLRVSDDSTNPYTIQYVSGYGTESPTVLATYYTYAALWNEYVAKYGTTGYVYDSSNATPNFFDEEKDVTFDHGTHVAGIIGALRNGIGIQGIAYNAEILPVKVDFGLPGGTFSHLSEVSQQAKVINLSIAPAETKESSESSDPEPRTIVNDPDSFLSHKLSNTQASWNTLMKYFDLKKTYANVASNGAVQVFAAGNHAQYQPSIYTAAPLVNEAFKNLVITTVALGSPSEATYHTDTGDIASYSNRCGAAASYCLSAPGGGATRDASNNYTVTSPIVSTGVLPTNLTDAYKLAVGTSQAAPVVSGSLAVLMGAFPFLTSQQAVQILLKTATYISPKPEEITAYNALASDVGGPSNAYEMYTVEGQYNAIYGHGLVNLSAATDPVGLPKITFDTTTNLKESALLSQSSANVSSVMAASIKALPNQFIVLDDYSRAYQVSPHRFIRSEKRQDGLRRSFRSFLAQDEKQVQTSDTLSFAFNSAHWAQQNQDTGSFSMMARPNKKVHMRLGFTQDTASFGGSYVGRILQNPFMNMRQALGVDLNVRFAQNWAWTAGAYTGKNGFVDEDIFDKMSKQSRMHLMESGVVYQKNENLTWGVSGGVMNEEDSLFGTRGEGAFKTTGAQTHYVRIVANYQPHKKLKLTGAYTYGRTQAQKGVSLMRVSRLDTESFGVTAEYKPDEKQTMGLKLFSPLRIRSGSVRFDLPVARDMYEDKIYREIYTAGLKPSAREYDVSLFYGNEISTALSWAGETGVRLNPDHQKQAPDYRALFKLNWMW